MLKRLALYRQFHRTCRWSAEVKPIAKKTKKAVTELPKTYVLPNGQPAAPLDAFVDVPGTLRASQRKRRAKAADDVTQDDRPRGAGNGTGLSFQPRTQLAREIHDNLQHFPHCLLLTRVGQFYESYFDQAEEIARLLNIKLTSRKWGGTRVPMCGFPLGHLDRHLKTLVQQNKRFVAMCEEFTKFGRFGEKEFERRVTRIVTPGTLIDEPFLDTYENNYLLSIQPCSEGPAVGLAWIDISTGGFFSKETELASLQDELARIAPKEVVLPAPISNNAAHPIISLLKEEVIFYSFAPAGNDTITTAESAAIALLSRHLQANLLDNAPTLESPARETDSTLMQIDSHTIKSLEIREASYVGGTKGTLTSVIRRTTTESGSRLLARRLCCPSTSLDEINGWQSAVAFFLQRHHLRADLIEKLKGMSDIGRIVQRFSLKRGDISDLLCVRNTISLWGDTLQALRLESDMEERRKAHKQEWKQIDILRNRMLNLEKLSARINDALPADMSDTTLTIEEEEEKALAQEAESTMLSETTFKWAINPSFSEILTNLHSAWQNLIIQKDELENRLRSTYNAPSLTLRASSSQGLHVHIAKGKRDCKLLDSDSNFTKLSETASTKCYFYRPWSDIGTMITTTNTALIQAERQAFETLRGEVVSNASLLRNNAATIDEMDVAISFATLAEELNFVRPTMSEERVYEVVNGRHPSVEMGLFTSGRTFTPNTIRLAPTSNMHIITGPNMAGKSTALRQTALIAILAQVGSFVPADFATIGLIDKLFTRIGAKDDLFRDRSTFMVEMLETADILRRATPRSLVIMDEVGRGTTVTDGLAIAFASIHHLVTQNQSSCLFATHFHELADMIGCSPNFEGKGVFHNVRYYCTDVNEIDDQRFSYSYRLKPGVNRDGHGLKVARLAGLPPSALRIASKTLSWLRLHDKDKQALPELNDRSEPSLVSS
ncbi:hypothetical protein NMY22_g9818 [Coprinellus aureogranulatus]|nr:hypothetical protein NMY22_g9818 [Coprinellus aureogranulatus]